MNIRCLIVLQLLFFGAGSFAQIAPECAGVEKPKDYDEDKQRAFMQNYTMASFLPLPVVDAHPSDSFKSSIGVDATFVPKLSCQERLALNGTKTEDANKSPIIPRPRFNTNVISKGPFSLSAAMSFLPPLPIPHFSLWHLGAESTFLYEPIKGVAVGARGFMGLGYVLAEIATPFDSKDPVKDDWFSFGIMGFDVLSSFGIPLSEGQKLYPFLSFGLVKGASLFVVGDDGVTVPNDRYPLFSLTNFVGISYHVFARRLNISLCVGGALDALMTGQLRFAYMF